MWTQAQKTLLSFLKLLCFCPPLFKLKPKCTAIHLSGFWQESRIKSGWASTRTPFCEVLWLLWESARDLLISARREARATGPAFPPCKIRALDANTQARKRTGVIGELGPQLLQQQPCGLICAGSEVTEETWIKNQQNPLHKEVWSENLALMDFESCSSHLLPNFTCFRNF